MKALPIINGPFSFKEGNKIRFQNERTRYTVQACNERFAVCTRPFNIKKTVLYTIIDLEKEIRGVENLIFCMGFETKDLCKEALDRLISGESEISRRNQIDLNIVEITT